MKVKKTIEINIELRGCDINNLNSIARGTDSTYADVLKLEIEMLVSNKLSHVLSIENGKRGANS